TTSPFTNWRVFSPSSAACSFRIVIGVTRLESAMFSGQKSLVSGMGPPSKFQLQRHRQMVRHRLFVGPAVLLQQRITADRSGNAHVLRREAIQQSGAQQHLVEQVPVIAKVLGALEVKGAARLAIVAEMVPHG